VVNTVSKILEMMEQELIIKVQSSKRISDPKPALTGARAMRVNELVETERKFVQDLEALQASQKELFHSNYDAILFLSLG
jgi:cell division control protein 24